MSLSTITPKVVAHPNMISALSVYIFWSIRLLQPLTLIKLLINTTLVFPFPPHMMLRLTMFVNIVFSYKSMLLYILSLVINLTQVIKQCCNLGKKSKQKSYRNKHGSQKKCCLSFNINRLFFLSDYIVYYYQITLFESGLL